MKDVLDRINDEITLRHQEVILLACLLNEHRMNHEVSPELLVPPEQFTHLVVRAFAHVLGKSFEAHQGEVLSLSQDSACTQGFLADLRFRATKEIVSVRTWNTPHSWLCIPAFDIWVDVLPPGSEPRWLSPVKYLPSQFRPPYTKKTLPETSRPRFSDIRALACLLEKLVQEKGTHC